MLTEQTGKRSKNLFDTYDDALRHAARVPPEPPGPSLDPYFVFALWITIDPPPMAVVASESSESPI
jgi:hypothetical protein